MKKIILLLLLMIVAAPLISFAQQKITRYCFIKPLTSGFTNGMDVKSIYVDYGQKSSISTFRDSTVKKSLDAVKNCKSYADITNYMESIGWTFVPGTGGITGIAILFTFKKDFDKSEIEINAVNRL